MVNASINGDLSVRVAVDTAAMDWSPSPSGSVWRKRVHRVGPAEAGQVTSVVRYEPNSTFPAHDHPDGEEILVLDGVFSDEHGDWPAGTFLLNPEGFRHAPFSTTGCTLLVKLRQFPGRKRRHVVVDTRTMPWESTPVAGIERMPLYRQDGFSDEIGLDRWQADADPGPLCYDTGAELFVLDGAFGDENGMYGRHCWLRFPAGSRHNPRSATGCTLYVKRGGFTYLHSVP